MVKTRGYKLIIFSLLIILSISCFSVLFINVWPLTKTEEKDVSSADLYVVGGVFYNEFYSKTTYDVYDIGYYKSLVKASNYYYVGTDELGSVLHIFPYSFQGRTINLQDDISFVGVDPTDFILAQDSRHPFKGTFNGNGYTITFSSQIATTRDITGSFCQYNSGTIKNTKFKDAVIQVEDGTISKVGVISYTNAGTITNCIVENCKFISDRWKSNCLISPIAGTNNGTVEHCMVNGSYQIGGLNANGILEDDGIYAYYFVSSGYAATNCIFTATVSKTNVTTETYGPGEYHKDRTVVTNEILRNFTSCSEAYNGKTDHTLQDCSSYRGPSDKDEYVWFKYKSTDYGYGGDSKYCVYLRLFVDWTTLQFTVNSSEAGYIADADFKETTASIIVPSDYDDVSEGSQCLTIDYTAEKRWALNKSGYSFSEWTSSGSRGGTKVYTAMFEGATCTISFWDYEALYESSGTILGDKTNCEDLKNITFDDNGKSPEYTVTYGTKLNVDWELSSKPNETEEYDGITYTYIYLKSITFSFLNEDENGNVVERKVTYRPMNEQYIICITDSDKDYQDGENPITSSTTISVFATLKTYNVTFG